MHSLPKMKRMEKTKNAKNEKKKRIEVTQKSK